MENISLGLSASRSYFIPIIENNNRALLRFMVKNINSSLKHDCKKNFLIFEILLITPFTNVEV